MICAFEEGTCLCVFDGCFATRDDAKAQIVDVPVGFCLIFRGDIVHNGMSYDSTNHRIHCYLSFSGLRWERDVILSVLPPHLACHYCGLKSLQSSEILQHRRYCSNNPAAEDNQETRRRTDNTLGEWICDVCGEKYNKSESFRSHVFCGHIKRREID